MAQIGELSVAITGDNSDLKKALNESSKEADKFGSQVAGAFASLGASVALFSGIVRGIEFNKAAEQAKVAFTVMTGSAKTAEKTLRELKDFANKTPLEFKDIRDATQTLVQFGLGAEEAVAMVKTLGDVSGGDAQKLQSLAIAMGQISSTGRLMGQDLNQLINAGFNPLKEISENTGRSMADLKKDMEAGAISADMVKDSFKRVTSEGGMFFGMLEKQADTITGKFSTMNDAVDTALGSLTESFAPLLKTFADSVTAMAGGFAELPAGIRAFAGAVTILGAATLTAIPALKMFGVTLTASMGPIALAVGATIALGTAIAAAVNDDRLKRYDELAKKFGYIAEQTGLSGKELEKFVDNSKMVEQALAGSVMLDRAKIDGIAKAYGMTAEQVAKIGMASKAVSDRHNALFGPIIGDAQKARATANKTAEDSKKASDLAKQQAEEKKIRDAEALAVSKAKQDALNMELSIKKMLNVEETKIPEGDAKAKADKAFADWKANEDRIENERSERSVETLALYEAGLDSQIEAEKQANAEKQAVWDASWKAFSDIITGMTQIVQNNAQMQIADLDEQQSLEMELLENGGVTKKERLEKELDDAIASGDTELANDKRIELEKMKVTKEFEQKKAKLKYDADMFAWGASMAQGIANAALSITNIWATHGANPILAGILTGISGAATAVQIGAIASAQPQPPKLWTGTTNPISSPGSYIVGDQGPEMVNLPAGASVLNNRDTMSALGGGQSGSMRATIQIMMDSMKIAESTVDIINNGLVRLEA